MHNSAADLQDFVKLRGYLGEDDSGQQTWDFLNQFTIKSNIHTLINLCQLSHLCTQTNTTSPFRSIRHEGGLDENQSFRITCCG